MTRLALSAVLGFLASQAIVSETRAGEPPHYTNVSTLEIHFKAKDPGPAGIKVVELWVTRDDGASWALGPNSEELEGWFPFPAPDEGPYGFWTRSIDRAGNEEPAPRKGDRPKIVAIVDRTRPRLDLLEPAEGSGLAAGRDASLVWEAVDPNLAEKPVTVETRRSPDAEWAAVEGSPFTARAAVTISLPPRDLSALHIRIAAADLAGNRSEVERVVAVGRPAVPPPTAGALAEAMSWCNRGRTHYKLAQFAQSEEAYRKALELVPGLAVAHHDLGVVHYATRRYDQALQNFLAALESEPESGGYRFSLGVAYYRLGRDEEALSHLTSALPAAKADGEMAGEILWTIGRIHERAGREEEAERAYRQIVEMGQNTRVGDARRKLSERSGDE